MRPALQNAARHLSDRLADGARPGDEALGRPLQVSAVGGGPVRGVGDVPALPVLATMAGDPATPAEDLDRGGGGTELQLLLGESVGHSPPSDVTGLPRIG
jgi:hypothetical protein